MLDNNPQESSSIFTDIQKAIPNKYMRLDLPLAVFLVLIQFDGASRQREARGSGNLIQTLLKNRFIDRMQLWIYPLTIGSGKRLFTDGTLAEKFKLVESKISSSGVVLD